MADDFQSISKGVFIVPYREPSEGLDIDDEPEAGPSRPYQRPLQGCYDKAYEAFASAHQTYETQRTEEQLEDIADWLEGCGGKMGGLEFGFDTRRLPLGIMQDTSPSLTDLLGRVAKHRVVLQGREVVDLSAGVRGIALGLMDDTSILGKSGRSAMDEVQRWYSALPAARQSPILIHILEAQIIPSAALSELIYVLSLRSSLPIRVLLSVPSISTFMASLSHIDPSGVEVDILGLGAKRASGGGVGAILKANAASAESKFRLGHDLVLEMEEDEKMFGGGAASALKALKWRLLHHGVNSPLATLINGDEEITEKVEEILRGGSNDLEILGDLLEIGPTREAQANLNPAPRVSVLHALSASTAYTNRVAKRPRKIAETVKPAEDVTKKAATTPQSAKRRRRTRTILSPEDIPAPVDAAPTRPEAEVANDASDQRGDLKELEVLFNLWRSAGRNVNLWDWLEGFRGSLMGPGAGEEAEVAPNGDEGTVDSEETGGRHAGRATDPRQDVGTPPSEVADEAAEEEKAARLHAVFVRFCEEARMLGLVRARGRAKRADEVVKSIGLV